MKMVCSYIVCPLLNLSMKGYYGNTSNVSTCTSGELLVVEYNEECVLIQGKYLNCPISNICKLKEAEPSNMTKSDSGQLNILYYTV